MASTFKIIQEGYVPPVKTIYINVKGTSNVISINPVGDDGRFHNPASVLRFAIEFNTGGNQCVGTTLDIKYSNLKNQQLQMEVNGVFGTKIIRGSSIVITDLGCDGEYDLPIYILNGGNQSDDTYDYVVRVV